MSTVKHNDWLFEQLKDAEFAAEYLNALVSGTTYVIYGTFSSNVFTASSSTWVTSTAADALVVVGDGTLLAATTTGIVILNDLTAGLASGNFV